MEGTSASQITRRQRVSFHFSSEQTKQANGVEYRGPIGSYQHKDLDKDPTGRSRRVFAETDRLQARPRQGVRVQQVREEFGHVPKLVGFQPAAKVKS